MRRRFWAVLTGVVLSALGVVSVLPAAFLAAGNAATRAGDHVTAEAHAGRASGWSVWQQWRPLFNRGLARYELHKFDAAAADFEDAAGYAPADQQCLVRLHWAWSLEAAADATQDDPDAATIRLGDAQLVLAAAQCDNAEQEEQRRETAERIEGKQNAVPPPTDTVQPTESDGADEQLQQRERQAQQQRQQAQDKQTPPPSVDEKTW